MTRFRMSDGMVVDTEKAVTVWEEERDFDGHNQIGRSSGSQWLWQTLYETRRGRYYTVTVGNNRSYAEWLSNEETARWLLVNHKPIPDSLAAIANDLWE